MLNEFIEAALDRVLERMKHEAVQSSPSLKKHLLQVFLGALFYNPSAALKYMQMKGILRSVLLEVFGMKKEFREPFEQKCFIMGMTSILDAVGPGAECPDEVKHPSTLGKLLQEIIDMLTSMQKREEKQAKSTGMKQLARAIEGDAYGDEASYGSDDYGSEDSYDDEEDELELDALGEDGAGATATKADPDEEVKASDQQMDLDGGEGGGITPQRSNGLTDKENREAATIDDFETRVSTKICSNFIL